MDYNSEILDLIVDIAQVSKEDIQKIEDLNLLEDLHFDSLMIVELLVKIEEKYMFEFDFGILNLDNIYNFNSLITTVKELLKEHEL